jgi:hypothetical protein
MKAPPRVFVCCRRDCAQGCGPAVRHPKEEPQWAQGPDGEGAAAACRIEGHRGGCYLCCVAFCPCPWLCCCCGQHLLSSLVGVCLPNGVLVEWSHVVAAAWALMCKNTSTPSVRWLHGGFDVVSGGAKIAVVSCCAVPCSAGSQSRPGSRSCQQQTHGHPDRPWRHNMLCCAVP